MGRPGAIQHEGGRSQPSVLLVSDERGWPQDSGYRRRTAQIASALAAVGPVTWVVAPRNSRDEGQPVIVPAELQDRIDAVLVSAPTRGRLNTAIRWLTGRLPWPLAAGDWSDVITELRHHRDTHRVVWAMGIDALSAIQEADIESRVMVVDADLESVKLARRIESDPPAFIRRAMARHDVGRWRRLEQQATDRTSGFSVCSADEAAILGPQAFVTPNSYPSIAATPGGARDSNRLLFVGSLAYRPNTDGLEWFIDEVFPRLRLERPELRLRVVGAGLADDHRLRRTESVHVVGSVDDVGAELAAAGGVVVPLRWGAGTRIKILEAFAHRTPVVSTTLGAEGLELKAGRELLIADDPVGFSDACGLALSQDPSIADMVERAHEVFRTTYEESIVTHRLTQRLEAMLEQAG